MILYLSSEQHNNLLDFWNERENKQDTPLKKMVGKFILKKFVVYDMRSFSHLTDLVLDRIAFGDSDEEFAEAIEEFLTMYQSRITVIYEGLKQTDAFFKALFDSGVGNFVLEAEVQGIRQEIRECLSKTGMRRYLSGGSSQKECYQFTCRNIKIAVVSSQPRIGATTVAVGLCSWLAVVGAQVRYVESNKSRHLRYLAGSYDMETTESGYFYEGVFYQEYESGNDVNFVVYDIGSEWLKDNTWVQTADRLVCVCGTKPYELHHTMRLRLQLDRRSGHVYLFCPFVAEEMRKELTTVLENDQYRLLFINYQPELTVSAINSELYFELVAGYVITV